jgi:hypothetical protein
MTWKDLLTDIRKSLVDPDEIGWPDSNLLQRVIVARTELWGSHQEAFYVTSVVIDLPADPTEDTLTNTIDFLPDWAQAIKAHVLWQCYMDDADERQNVKLAEDYYAVWARKVG